MNPQDSLSDMRSRALAPRGGRAPGQAAHADLVRELLEVHMPPLQARLRQPLIDELALRVLELEPESRAFLDDSTPMRLASLLMHVRNVVRRLQEEALDLSRSAKGVVDEYHGAAGPRQRRAVLERAIDELSADRFSRRRDLRALDRKLGIEAVQERYSNRRHDVLACIEMGLAYIGGAIEGAVTDESSSTARAWKELRRAEIHTFLAEELRRPQSWQARLACMRSLIRAFELLDLQDRDGEIAPILAERIADPSEHPWVQSGALRVLWHVNPSQALAISRRRLLHSHAHGGRDFVFRGRAVQTLGRFAEDMRCLNLLRQVAVSQDPSEYVRIGVCHAVALAIPRRADLLDVLATLAGLPPGPEERSPRVRAHALMATAQAVRGCLTAESRTLDRCVDSAALLVATVLREDTDDLVLTVACQQAVEIGQLLATHSDDGLGQAFSLPIFESLLRLIRREDVSGRVQEAAAACLESLEMDLSPARREWFRYLRRAVGSVAPGKKERIDLSAPGLPATPSAEVIGRTLAAITRDDWGVDIVEHPGLLEVRRGDRFELKRWRLVHELRSPAPNKRQAHQHTLGRKLEGSMRAPSGILDEVTPTVVPGERQHCGPEGGWGRHLPLVDDLLDLPAAGTRIFSSHGVTSVVPTTGPRAVKRGCQRDYAMLARLRMASLEASETYERGAYARALHAHGVQIRFEAHPVPSVERPRTVSPALVALFESGKPRRKGPDLPVQLAASSALVPTLPSGERVLDWLRPHVHYFLTLEGNSQTALALVLIGVGGVFFGTGYRRRAKFDAARRLIPLAIGGWGSRGKSGTERLKAGLFHGLGYRTYAKTTGCEAMFIHSQPGGDAQEIYAFRPYGKASIWEQRDHVELAAALGTEVFLWECMALNPRYVEILQRTWMRDDLSTITNAYPDHEDIQGPSGLDVANAIARFVPAAGKLISSETNFAPVLRDRCRELGTSYVGLDTHAGELIAEDLLDLFPYEEHPRNIALCARLAEELGVDPELAIITMAEHVVPDLGVLQRFPDVCVRGRKLSFINGCSANERQGFLTNWTRMGLDRLTLEANPERAIVTVVNNRDDRISRSEVFARILVNDIAADRHVLIGTNLRGLRRYIDEALDDLLGGELLLSADAHELSEDNEAVRQRPLRRLARLMARLRIGEPTMAAARSRLTIYAGGLGVPSDIEGPAQAADFSDVLAVTATYIEGEAELGALTFEAVKTKVWTDKSLAEALEQALGGTESQPRPKASEVLAPASVQEAIDAYRRDLVRWTIYATLRRRLEACLESASAQAVLGVQREAASAYRSLFAELLIVVDNPGATGDQIVDVCAKSVGPGLCVDLLGCQNIKGTGLDFVYRFMAVQLVDTALTKLDSLDKTTRLAGLNVLERFEDDGLMDSGMVVARVQALPPAAEDSAEEKAARERIVALARTRHARHRDALANSRLARSLRQSVLGGVESWIDFVDGALRYHASRRLRRDLIESRISHPRMAVEMRQLYARAKGGWLDRALRRTK